jgi:nicotinamidase-related amidase
MRPALIVVDMQQGSFGPESPRHDAQGLVERLNRLAARVRNAGGLVVFVLHAGPEGDPHHSAQPGHALLPELDRRPEDLIMIKSSCDAFLGTTLDETLFARAVGQLIVTGCATDYCVDTTVRAALAKGYPTVAPSDGHTTSDRPHLAAAKIIQHHNAIWADFLSPAGPATVCPCEEIAL